MPVAKKVSATIPTFKTKPENARELERLRDFMERMKAEGIATTRGYDIPRPDTLGRSIQRPTNAEWYAPLRAN